jgi:hypothetical protein
MKSLADIRRRVTECAMACLLLGAPHVAGAADWALDWHDEFDGCAPGQQCAIDGDKWQLLSNGSQGGGNNTANQWLETYQDPIEGAQGVLVQRTMPSSLVRAGNGDAYSGAGVTTGSSPDNDGIYVDDLSVVKKTFEPPVGGLARVDVRFKAKIAAGIRQTIWLFAPRRKVTVNGKTYCPQAEIDGVELGSGPDGKWGMGIHIAQWDDCVFDGAHIDKAMRIAWHDMTEPDINYDDGRFHLLSMVWGDPYVRSYLDGKLVNEWIAGTPSTNGPIVKQWTFTHGWPMFLRLGRGVCAAGNFDGNCSFGKGSFDPATARDSRLQADYTRFYTCPDTSCAAPAATDNTPGTSTSKTR